MTTSPPVLIARRWRSRRSAAVAGVAFAVLLVVALVMLRLAAPETGLEALAADAGRRRTIRLSLHLVPFAGIAFLWFIGVVRDQLGQVEDRLFSTVFLGSGLLFLALLFQGAAASTSLLDLLAGSGVGADVWGFGRGATATLISVYGMRMAAVFTFSVSTVALRTHAVPRWVALLGYAVGLLLLLAAGGNPWVQLAFPGWVLLLSVAILATPPPARPAITDP
jgi:hypothetical protein